MLCWPFLWLRVGPNWGFLGRGRLLLTIEGAYFMARSDCYSLEDEKKDILSTIIYLLAR